MTMAETGDGIPDNFLQERYRQFHVYDFESDEKFQDGWKKVAQLFEAEDEKSLAMMKAKLFFYSKVFERVKMPEYIQWLKVNNKDVTGADLKGIDSLSSVNGTLYSSLKTLDKDQTCDGREHDSTTETDSVKTVTVESESEAEKKISSYNSTSQTQKHEAVTELKVICDSTKQKTSKSEDEIKTDGNSMQEIGEVKELNFEQIADMLDKGLKLPGIEDLHIEPTNADPTPSAMERIKKPWEK